MFQKLNTARSRILFELSVNYKSPSQETLFLESGWGIRDVSGPYLTAHEGKICVSPWVLSPVIASTIRLRFEMSNRALLDAVSLQAIGDFGIKSCFIERNKASELMIEN